MTIREEVERTLEDHHRSHYKACASIQCGHADFLIDLFQRIRENDRKVLREAIGATRLDIQTATKDEAERLEGFLGTAFGQVLSNFDTATKTLP